MDSVQNEPSDEKLVPLIAAGDRDAFVVVYRRHVRRMYAWAVARVGRDRAEDATQELFLKLWAKAGTFDPARGSFSAWFFSIARHQLIAEAERMSAQQRVKVAAELDSMLSELGVGPDPADQFELLDDHSRLIGAIGALPEEQKLAIALAYFAGLTQSEIAARMGWPLGTVKKRIRLGMAKLRIALVPGSLRVMDGDLLEELGGTS
jgi:RNA polymerase sigma-70 factor (ECF subfamily)